MKTCKGSCHLESKMPKQMPFKMLRYIILFTRYEGKSEMVSLHGGHIGFSHQTGCCYKNKRNVSLRTQDIGTNAVQNFKIYHLIHEI